MPITNWAETVTPFNLICHRFANGRSGDSTSARQTLCKISLWWNPRGGLTRPKNLLERSTSNNLCSKRSSYWWLVFQGCILPLFCFYRFLSKRKPCCGHNAVIDSLCSLRLKNDIGLNGTAGRQDIKQNSVHLLLIVETINSYRRHNRYCCWQLQIVYFVFCHNRYCCIVDNSQLYMMLKSKSFKDTIERTVQIQWTDCSV